MNKRKILLVASCLMMVAILGFGGTLAYLTDTDNTVNTFVAGQVGLKLDEEIVAKDTDSNSDTYGDFLATGERTEENQKYEKVFPGNDILKDPTITLDATSETAWVAAKIVITGKGLNTLIGSPVLPEALEITREFDDVSFISGGLADIEGAYLNNGYYGLAPFFYCEDTTGNNSYYSYQVAGDGVWTIYMYMDSTMAANEQVTLFNNIHIPTTWNNAEIAIINGMTVDITAYAVQADGFADCFTAMATAFPAAFPQAK